MNRISKKNSKTEIDGTGKRPKHETEGNRTLTGTESLHLVAFGRIDQIFTTMSEQVLLVLLTRGGADLARVDIHSVLALFRESDVEGDHIIADVMGRIFGQLLLLSTVLVQSGHEVR